MPDLRRFAIPALAFVALVQSALLALYGWGRVEHASAYEDVQERLGPLDPVRFVYEGQRPHPLLDVAATLFFDEDTDLIRDWVDKIAPSVLDEFLDFSVIEDGTLIHRCDEARRHLDWALDGTEGHFGVDYPDYNVDLPPGFGTLMSLDRLIFLCGWTSLREGDPDSAVDDAQRLGRLASVIYREPALWNLTQATHAETRQQHLLQKLLAEHRISSDQALSLRSSLPTCDLHQQFVTAMTVEAMRLESELEYKLSDGYERMEEEPLGWLGRIAIRSALDQMAARAYATILSYVDSYGLPYAEIQDRLALPRKSDRSLSEHFRAELSINDWRYVARPQWVDHHRKLAAALLQVATTIPTPGETCREIRSALGDLSRPIFEVTDETGGCRVHYVYGKDYLWPSKERVLGNPTGDWWLPER